MMMRANARAVEGKAGSRMFHVAQWGRPGTGEHVQQAHDGLNGLLPAHLTLARATQAREWLRNPSSFEATAFVFDIAAPRWHAASFRTTPCWGQCK